MILDFYKIRNADKLALRDLLQKLSGSLHDNF